MFAVSPFHKRGSLRGVDVGPFLWDEIKVPVKYGCDHHYALEVLERVAERVVGSHAEEAEVAWRNLVRKYRLEHAQTAPMVGEASITARSCSPFTAAPSLTKTRVGQGPARGFFGHSEIVPELRARTLNLGSKCLLTWFHVLFPTVHYPVGSNTCRP